MTPQEALEQIKNIITQIDTPMWKLTPTLDSDKDAATLTANFLEDDKVTFTYSRRVSLYKKEDIDSFLAEAKAAKTGKSDFGKKEAEYIKQLEKKFNEDETLEVSKDTVDAIISPKVEEVIEEVITP